MDRKDPLRDVELLIKSRHGLIVLDTAEDERAELLMQHVADRMSMPLFIWTRTQGLRRDGNTTAVYGTSDGGQALAHIASANIAAIYHLHGFASLLQNEAIAERLREVALRFSKTDGAIVL